MNEGLKPIVTCIVIPKEAPLLENVSESIEEKCFERLEFN